jgi:hypothetical protein
MSSTISFRIVSLPRELQNEKNVAWYISDVLQFGTIASVDIVQKTATNGLQFRSANIVMQEVSPLFPSSFIEEKVYQLPSYISEHMNNNGNFQFHFDNGKPMLHVKCVIIENTAPSSEVVEIKDSWSSIYIPVLPKDLEFAKNSNEDLQTEEGLKHFFETALKIGEVSRVDFVSRSLQDSSASTVRSAYIHFKNWFDTNLTRVVRQQIECSGEYRLRGFVDNSNNKDEYKSFKNNRFLVLKMNKTPIPEANPEANVHQLAARNRELEERVAELEAKIRQLEEEKMNAHIVNDQGPMTIEELMVGHA